MEQGERNIARSYGGDNLYHSNERPEIIILLTVVYNSAKVSYTNHASPSHILTFYVFLSTHGYRLLATHLRSHYNLPGEDTIGRNNQHNNPFPFLRPSDNSIRLFPVALTIGCVADLVEEERACNIPHHSNWPSRPSIATCKSLPVPA